MVARDKHAQKVIPTQSSTHESNFLAHNQQARVHDIGICRLEFIVSRSFISALNTSVNCLMMSHPNTDNKVLSVSVIKK